MKHLKLFEEFKDSKWELKPGVKIQGDKCVVIDNMSDFKVLIDYLESDGYSDPWEGIGWATEQVLEGEEILVRWWETVAPSKPIPLGAPKRMTFAQILTSDKIDYKFSDLFQLKYKYRGHKLKKFGV
jgi:hypothetical protein